MIIQLGSRRHKKGFTLLEIMIALAIIGTSLIMILHTVNRHADITYENNIRTEMYQFAKIKIAEMSHSPGQSQGTDRETGLAYSLSALATEHPDILELRVHVTGHDNSVVLNEFVTRGKE